VKAIQSNDPSLVKSPYADGVNSLAAVLAANVSAADGGRVIDVKAMGR
jgi:hypothetical protein